MIYRSTRGRSPAVTLSEAILDGLAPDGGLYVPERFPREALEEFDGADDISDVAVRLLAPFFEGDVLAAELPAICRETFDFPIPLRALRDETYVLEIFHGPTAAFKDVGARFLARCMRRLQTDARRRRTILVATSGDTGGAVAAAFHGEPDVDVFVLYPEGRISSRQEHQLTCWGGNVTALAVRGDFDDCQRLVKAAFVDPALRAARALTSANSINIGRLLPQMAYFAYSVALLCNNESQGPGLSFFVPSGNAGNALAALYTRACGLPLRDVVMATNANATIPDYLTTGTWRPRATVATLASAMDVGDPSNMERVFALVGNDPAAARRAFRAFAVDDNAIRDTIRRGERDWGEVWDPHTAAAVHVRELLVDERGPSVIVATAHPAKFENIVEPLVGHAVAMPPALAALLERSSHAERLEPTLDALRDVLL
jgi:threonine synthase